MAADPSGAANKLPKTKEEALDACVEQHAALIACFKTCSLWSSFTGCCVEEHKRFWDCYKAERGTNATKVQAWLEDKFSASPLVQQQEGEEQGRGSGASGSSSGAGAGSGGRASNKQQ